MKINEEQKQQYQEYVKQVTPTHNLLKEVGKAFLTGGLICVLGQFLQNTGLNIGMDQKIASTWCSILLVLLSVLLTGFNIYPSIAKWGGAGALVPITGFANGIASSAIEYKKEGQVFGIGSKIFTIAKILEPIPKTCPSLRSQVLSSSMESLLPGSLA